MHLQAFAGRRKARLDDGLRRVDAVVEQPRVPGDLLRLVAQEIGVVELRPQLVLRVLRHRVEAKLRARFVLARLHAGRHGERRAGEETARRASRGLRAASPSTRSRPSGWCRGCRRPSADRARSGAARRRRARRTRGSPAGSAMSCFCAVADITRWFSTSHATSSASSRDEPVRARRSAARPRRPSCE